MSLINADILGDSKDYYLRDHDTLETGGEHRACFMMGDSILCFVEFKNRVSSILFISDCFNNFTNSLEIVKCSVDVILSLFVRPFICIL
jgi:hypothetical protein